MAVHLLVGAAGGIGSALARTLTDRGDTVVLAGRTAATLEPLADELGQPWRELDARDFGEVEALVRSAAATYGARGVRVNAVAPGLVVTPQTRSLVDNERQAEASRSMHVLGRFGEPQDVASALAWLVDPTNGWVTGQVLGVDGGLGHVRTRAR